MNRMRRSTREAFPAERFPAVFGPYRARGRWLLPLGYLCLAAIVAGLALSMRA
jgi:hypothetical protein